MRKNLEVKSRILSIEWGRKKAEEIQARFDRMLIQTDTYFLVEKGRLKLREIERDRTELIYYNRAEETDRRESDFEITPIHDASAMKSLLSKSLGVKTIVHKERMLFMYDETRIHIDHVEGLGTFLEFEVPVSKTMKSAEETLEILIHAFGIRENDFIRESYSDLLMNEKKEV